MKNKKLRFPTALFLALALALLPAALLSACGSNDTDTSETAESGAAAADTAESGAATSDTGDSGAAAADTSDSTTETAAADTGAVGGFPVTIETTGGEVTIEKAPQKIVSLSPSATEMLFAIGAGDQVVAVDSYSYFPEEAPVTDLSGWDPNVEAVLGYEPDLVVISNDANDLVASMTEVGVPVLISAAPANLEGGYAELANLGVATGKIDETAAVVAKMRADAAAAFDAAPKDSNVRIYHELDSTFFSASSHGFVGSIYAELGAENIADSADADKTGYPQLSEEYIVEADPQIIIITDQAGYSAEDVAKRAGWENISAVKNGNIIVVNTDIASRWGPRLPQFITIVAEALESAKAPA